MSSDERGLDDRLRWLLLRFASALGGFSASLATSGLASATAHLTASGISTFFSGLSLKFTSSNYTSGSLTFSATLAGGSIFKVNYLSLCSLLAIEMAF